MLYDINFKIFYIKLKWVFTTGFYCENQTNQIIEKVNWIQNIKNYSDVKRYYQAEYLVGVL